MTNELSGDVTGQEQQQEHVTHIDPDPPVAAEPLNEHELAGSEDVRIAAIDTILHVDPGTLIIDVNVRLDPRVKADKGFIQSIRENGVLDAVAAYYNDEGQLVVHRGQRRTLGAREAERPTIPVRVIAKPDGVDHVVRQLIENEQRAAMGVGETSKAYEQLGLQFGLSAGQIARKTGKKKTDIETHLAVAHSELATKAADRHGLDLVHSAAVAEFHDDPETAKALILAVKAGQFEHVLAKARQAREVAAQRAALVAELAEQTIHIVDEVEAPITYLVQLGMHRNEVREEHARTCEGHAVYLDRRYDWQVKHDVWQAVPVCIDPDANGHKRPESRGPEAKTKMADLPPEQQETQRTERRAVIANNKAWTAAVEVRRTWLREQLLGRKTAPAGAELFIAEMLMSGHHWVNTRDGAELFGTVLGAETDVVKATPKRATLLAAVRILADWEATAGPDGWQRNKWRNHDDRDRLVLAQMVAWGYPPSPVEQLILQDVKGLVQAPEVGTPMSEVLAAYEEAKTSPVEVPEQRRGGLDEAIGEDQADGAIEPPTDADQPLEEEGNLTAAENEGAAVGMTHDVDGQPIDDAPPAGDKA